MSDDKKPVEPIEADIASRCAACELEYATGSQYVNHTCRTEVAPSRSAASPPNPGMDYWWNRWIDSEEPVPVSQMRQPQAMTAVCYALDFAQWFAERCAEFGRDYVACAAPPSEREAALREKIAKALWNAEIAEEQRHKPNKDFAQWPEDAARQPYCQSTYRMADAVVAVVREFNEPFRQRMIDVAKQADEALQARAAVPQAAAQTPDRVEASKTKFPKHKCGLYLTHNEHRDVYEKLPEWIADLKLEDAFQTPEAMKRAIETDDLWVLQWYPDTPVGFYRVAAPTLEELFDALAGATAPPKEG